MQHVQAHVPEFRLAPPQLLSVVDDIADHAAQALDLGQVALGLTSGEAREAVSMLLQHVRRIGFAADASVDDCTADLAAVWGVGEPTTGQRILESVPRA
ncbi:hypothetical protein [Roseateles sp.]|uniref:hypothetical protein n=1 Tax=Roseateles sp. TaxID=1971397 RepID=UPI003264AC4A